MSSQPKISIITACYNAEQTIEQTIQSVINQTYDNIEYIIVDGASSDRTMEIIRRYEGQIDIILSEPDKGVYDAFNKGAKIASGDYIQYLNADDYLSSNDVIKEISDFIAEHPNPALVYGGILMINEITDYKIVRNKLFSFDEIKRGKMIPHPATFVQKDILLTIGLFNTRYKIAADYDLICRIYKKYENSIFHYPKFISNFRIGGLSSDFKNRERVKFEVEEIANNHFDNGVNEELQISNEGYLKKWIEKQLYEDKSIARLLNKMNITRVALWGTGEIAIIIYKELSNNGISVSFYLDNNQERQALSMNGLSILSPDSLSEKYEEIDAIIMSFEGRHEDSVLQQILGYNLPVRLPVYSWRDLVKEL